MLLAWKLRSSISTNMAPDVLNLLLNAEERECCLLFQATMNGAHHQVIKPSVAAAVSTPSPW